MIKTAIYISKEEENSGFRLRGRRKKEKTGRVLRCKTPDLRRLKIEEN